MVRFYNIRRIVRALFRKRFSPHPQPLSPEIRSELDQVGKLSRPNLWGEGSPVIFGSFPYSLLTHRSTGSFYREIDSPTSNDASERVFRDFGPSIKLAAAKNSPTNHIH